MPSVTSLASSSLSRSSSGSFDAFCSKLSSGLACRLKKCDKYAEPIDITISFNKKEEEDDMVVPDINEKKTQTLIDLSLSDDESNDNINKEVVNSTEVDVVDLGSTSSEADVVDLDATSSDRTVHLFTYQEELQRSIDDACLKLYQDWQCQLLMDVNIDNVVIPKTDIMQYVKMYTKKSSELPEDMVRPYFDLNEYKLCDKGFKGNGFAKLTTDLGKEAIRNGFTIIKSGFPIRRGVTCQFFKCNRGLPYRGDLKKKCDVAYRKLSYSNDKTNSRGQNGLKGPRKCTTYRPICKGNLCTFGFFVSFDHKGFYILPGLGNASHLHHPRLEQNEISFPTRLLTSSKKKIVSDLHKATANGGVSERYLYQSTGHIISRQSIAYLNGLCNDMKKMDNISVQNSTEKMIKYLVDHKYDHVVLYHNHADKKLYNQANLDVGYNRVVSFPTVDQNDASQYISETRSGLNVGDDQDLMIAIAWVLPLERQYLSLYPEVIFVDCIADTNKDNRPLLTATGKDANGKMFTFFRAFLPNERGWVFRWIFSHVFTLIFDEDILSKVKLVVTDGCMQEFSQIDAALPKVFKNAQRCRCGFHIVRMGWRVHVIGKNCIDRKHHNFYDKVCKQLKLWIYSWMKSSCETLHEYLTSKLMFFKFLNTIQIRETLGEVFISSVTRFVRKHVEIHESLYAFHERFTIRHFDSYSNSCHEGTNNGIRHSTAKVGPSTNIENTMLILNSNSDFSHAKKRKLNSQKYVGRKLYTELNCSKYLVDMGFSILQNSWERRNHYDSIYVGKDKWYVKYQDIRRVQNVGLYPHFKRIRIVTNENGFLKCSCNFRSRFGIDCAHVYHVASKFEGYDEPSHHECSVRWWSAFNKYGLYSNSCRSANETHLNNFFKELQENDLTGLPVRYYAYDHLPVVKESNLPEEFTIPQYPVCTNYPNLQVFPEELEKKKHDVAGFTQTSTSFPKYDVIDIPDDDFKENFQQCIPIDDMRCIDPYSELKPYFIEMISVMKKNCDVEDINLIKVFFEKKISHFKSKAMHTSKTKGKIVSSTCASSKRKKAHGTRY